MCTSQNQPTNRGPHSPLFLLCLQMPVCRCAARPQATSTAPAAARCAGVPQQRQLPACHRALAADAQPIGVDIQHAIGVAASWRLQHRLQGHKVPPPSLRIAPHVVVPRVAAQAAGGQQGR